MTLNEEGDSKDTEVKLEQLIKHCVPISSTDEGIVIEVNPESLKVPVLKTFTEEGDSKDTEVNPVQCSKHCEPISSTEEGIVTEVNPEQN